MGDENMSKPLPSGPSSDVNGVHQDERPNVETAIEASQTTANLALARNESKG